MNPEVKEPIENSEAPQTMDSLTPPHEQPEVDKVSAIESDATPTPASQSDGSAQSEPLLEAPEPPAGLIAEKKKGKLWLWLAIVAVLLAIVGGVVYYMLYIAKDTTASENNNTATKKTETPKPSTSSATLVAQSLVEGSKSRLEASTYKTKDLVAPQVKADGFGFYVVADVYYALSASGTKTQMEANLAELKSYLMQKGFTMVDEHSETQASITYYATYTSRDAACTVTNNLPYPENAKALTHEAILSCADMSAVKTLAEKIKPFDAVFTEKATNYGKDGTLVSYGAPQIKDSATAGYKMATVSTSSAAYGSVGGFAGLYYQTPDKMWHFFKGAQSVSQCSEYNTVDLKKAYLGEPCGVDGKADLQKVTL